MDMRLSQKDIQRMLESEIGKPLCPDGKRVIKEEIDLFLMERASQPQDGGSGETDDVTPSLEGASAKRQLDVDGSSLIGGGAEKRSKSSTTQTQRNATAQRAPTMSEALPGNYQISTRRFVGVSKYGGKLLVNIREYYEKDGALAPGAKGISLTVAQFEELGRKARLVDAALEKQPFEETQLKLSENRFVTVREYAGNLLVDVREYYQKNLEMLPGKKGISLTAAEQWMNLKAAIPALMNQLANEGGTEPRTQADLHQEASRRPVGQSTALPAGEAVLVEECKYRLGSSKKFVALENWKGQDVIDIREHYEGDTGTWKPGKKGSSLSGGQTRTLLTNLDAITNALDQHDLSYVLDLNNKRRVTISSFNNNWMVNIREYYERDGQLLPTKKGISLMPQQWPPCREALTKLGDKMSF
jgi:hypothetical protein